MCIRWWKIAHCFTASDLVLSSFRHRKLQSCSVHSSSGTALWYELCSIVDIRDTRAESRYLTATIYRGISWPWRYRYRHTSVDGEYRSIVGVTLHYIAIWLHILHCTNSYDITKWHMNKHFNLLPTEFHHIACELSSHSVNGDIAIQWEWSHFDPSQNPNPLTDYDITLHNWLSPRDEHVTQNLCQSAVRERLAKYVKYKAVSFYLRLAYWSDVSVAFDAQSLKHAESRKDVPLWGFTWWPTTFRGSISPKAPKGAWIGNVGPFHAKIKLPMSSTVTNIVKWHSDTSKNL